MSEGECKLLQSEIRDLKRRLRMIRVKLNNPTPENIRKASDLVNDIFLTESLVERCRKQGIMLDLRSHDRLSSASISKADSAVQCQVETAEISTQTDPPPPARDDNNNGHILDMLSMIDNKLTFVQNHCGNGQPQLALLPPPTPSPPASAIVPFDTPTDHIVVPPPPNPRKRLIERALETLTPKLALVRATTSDVIPPSTDPGSRPVSMSDVFLSAINPTVPSSSSKMTSPSASSSSKRTLPLPSSTSNDIVSTPSIKRSIKSIDYPTMCTLCGFHGATYSELWNHECMVDRMTPPPFDCCNKAYKRLGCYKNHRRKIHHGKK